MKNSYPKISVVTCTCNSEKFLEKALSSVVKQKYKNIEHIINDSYSTDRTLEIIDKYINKNKGKYDIKLIHTAAKGVANALNNATEYATGDIIHYLHSDDYYFRNNSLQKVAKHFRKDPNLVWLTGNFAVEIKGEVITIPHTPILKANLKRALSVMNVIHHENTFVKTDAIKKCGGFNEDKDMVVEYRLWLNLLKDHKPLIVNDQFAVFIIHKGSTSTGSIYKFSKAVMRAFRTQRREKIIPFIGYYEDKALYKDFLNVVKNVKRFAKYAGFSD